MISVVTYIILFVNLVDLVASFPLPHSTPQSEFPIKSYDCLKLKWSDFDFYFLCLSSLFLISFFFFFSVSLSSLFLYMKTDEKGLWSVGFLFLNFNFWIVGLGWTNGEMGNPWEQMLLVRGDILYFCAWIFTIGFL
jgi:hypothetical protein